MPWQRRPIGAVRRSCWSPRAATGSPGVTVDRVETAAEMEAAVLGQAAVADVVVMAAAVADFRPATAAGTKMHKADGVPQLVLEATPDILAELGRRRRPRQVLVGFAAETDAVTERATAKLAAKGVDLVVANDVSAPGVGFDHDTNAVTIFGADGRSVGVPLRHQGDVADAILIGCATPLWIPGCAPRCPVPRAHDVHRTRLGPTSRAEWTTP